MNITRNHIIILAVISIFTGMIAPTVSGIDLARPYAMTNMQYVAYWILFLSTILFFTTNFQLKKISYFLSSWVIVLVFSLFLMTIAGMVKSFGGISLPNFSWWWIFLAAGLLLLVSTFLIRFEEETSTQLFRLYEKIIGVVGFFVLLALSFFIISIAHMSSEKSVIPTTVSKAFGKDARTVSGSLVTPSFENIQHVYFDRATDFLSFVATASGQSLMYPERLPIRELENLEEIRHIGGKIYFIQKDGTIIENKEAIGKANIDDISANILYFQKSDGKYTFVSSRGEQSFDTEGKSIDKVFYNESTGDIYWRSHAEGGQAIYKNNARISEIYPGILRFSVAKDGALIFVAENADRARMVVKNNVVIHTMRDDYVQGSLQMNGNDTLYVIQNADDGSYSIIVNGTIMDRKLDEIREVFLDKNSNGFSYFGRLQGENRYCLFTRYKGNICNIDAYMNPNLEGDDAGIIFAGLRDGRWSIYRNTTEFISGINYGGKTDISHDYFFFDPTNPRYYLFVEKTPQGYQLNKQGKRLPEIWEDINISSVKFGYNEAIILSVKDGTGWKMTQI